MNGFNDDHGWNVLDRDFGINKVYEAALEYFEFDDYNQLFEFLDAYEISNKRLRNLMVSLYKEEEVESE